MLFSKSTPKPRSYWIAGISVLILFVTTYILAHAAVQPAEPWISVKPVETNYVDGKLRHSDGVTNPNLITVEVSNRMSFNVDYLVLVHVEEKHLSYSAQYAGSITRRSKTALQPFMVPPMGSPEGTKWTINYERQLKPVEKSVLSKWPWLKQHYPFNPRRRSFTFECVIQGRTNNAL